jgi:N-acetylglucosaminyldiphosphoundecaprenol N-acetyl-beta-D-mannosaminyltransferase
MNGIYAKLIKRLLDVFLAIAISLVLLPFLLLSLLIPGVRMIAKRRIGRQGLIFGEYRLHCPASGPGRVLERISFHRIPALWNIIHGQMSFIGPRALEVDDALPAEGVEHVRFRVRPGYISAWWLRVRTNMTFDDEFSVDASYVTEMSLKRDAGIALRAVPALLYGRHPSGGEATLSLLGVRIANLQMAAAIERIERAIKERSPAKVYFVNADSLNKAFRDATFRTVLNAGDIVLGDGIGVNIGARLTKQHIRENVNGTDMFPRLCERMARERQRLYLLGAKEGIAERVSDWVRTRHPGVILAGVRNGYFSDDETDNVCAAVRASGADVLLVAFGAPRQEAWIHENFANLGVCVAIGVGGLFDFYSGSIPRAPVWMREVGIEWIYRLIQEPRRMYKRYLVGNFLFMLRVLRHGRVVRSHRSRGKTLRA